MARYEAEKTWQELTQRYGIDAFWYPGIDIGLLPNGPLTEVESLRSLLLEAGLSVDPARIASTFDLKRAAYAFVQNHSDIVASLTAATEPRSGSTLPVSFEVAQLVTYGVLILAAKGFLTEFGKDAYQALKNALRRRIRDEAEVEVVIRATHEFIKSNPDIVVRIQRTGKSAPRPSKRSKRRKKNHS